MFKIYEVTFSDSADYQNVEVIFDNKEAAMNRLRQRYNEYEEKRKNGKDGIVSITWYDDSFVVAFDTDFGKYCECYDIDTRYVFSGESELKNDQRVI